MSASHPGFAAVPRQEVPDGLPHHHGSGSPADCARNDLELIEGRRRCRGVPETTRATGRVVPDFGIRDVLIDQAVGWHPDETTERTLR